MFEEKRRGKYNSETSRHGRGRRRTWRDRREEWDAVNRASWRLTIKDYGSTDVMQLSSTIWITIRMNCGKLRSHLASRRSKETSCGCLAWLRSALRVVWRQRESLEPASGKES